MLRDVVPGARHAYAEVRHAPSARQYWVTGNSHIFGHAACFAILARATGTGPQRFWAAVRRANFAYPAANGICGVEYGAEVDATQGHGVLPLANFGPPPLPAHIVRALDSSREDEHAVKDFWLGRGAMWVFVRPDECVRSRSSAGETLTHG